MSRSGGTGLRRRKEHGPQRRRDDAPHLDVPHPRPARPRRCAVTFPLPLPLLRPPSPLSSPSPALDQLGGVPPHDRARRAHAQRDLHVRRDDEEERRRRVEVHVRDERLDEVRRGGRRERALEGEFGIGRRWWCGRREEGRREEGERRTQDGAGVAAVEGPRGGEGQDEDGRGEDEVGHLEEGPVVERADVPVSATSRVSTCFKSSSETESERERTSTRAAPSRS